MRIIGGLWRGRRLSFPARADLRPSPDRVRETLFNWLAPHLPGTRCLDLFAGSGVLGFEALSRGAQEATLVEKDPLTETALRQTAGLLRTETATIIQDEALRFLAGLSPRSFDIVFLDPPFGTGLLQAALTLIISHGILAPGGLLYIETAVDETVAPPAGLRWHRQGRAGQVAFGLVTQAQEPL
ncbi:MAG TPA: 16S rRNA (guanine(966)-N(2))-methyltransferase RsmD [Acidiferrobacter sp.]|nr:16S rRNA (guanine(966)-N(2))-methyltransferase RsmD [Acidiferrobacter sp.]